MIDPTRLPISLPAALVTFWGTHRDQAIAAFRETVGEKPGVHWASPHQCAVSPTAGDPAIFDAALAIASGVLLCASYPGNGRGNGRTGDRGSAQALICPCRVRLVEGGTELTQDPLIDDLAQRPPRCADGVITMTSISTTQLEHARRFHEAGIYEGPSGRMIPLVQVGAEAATEPPWRNPTVLRSSRPYIRRPEFEERLRQLLANGARSFRVSGGLGCGKTRLLWQALREFHGIIPLWATTRPVRHGGPLLAAQLAAQLLHRNTEAALAVGLERHEIATLLDPHQQPVRLLDPQMASELIAELIQRTKTDEPVVVVCDGLEAATPREFETLNYLVDIANERGTFKLVLIARPATPWPEDWWVLPQLEVKPMLPAEMEEFSQGTFAGLSLPQQVKERFLTAAAGNPFALEEGLAGLIPLKQVRQVYGSFFFSGADDSEFAPSARWTTHVEAEARRLGGIAPLRRLAVADTPLPSLALTPSLDPATPTAGPLHEEWRKAMVEYNWLHEAESPWGPGVAFPCPAYGLALAHGLSDKIRDSLRQELGQHLWQQAQTEDDKIASAASWWIYRLLDPTPQATRPLLAAARSASPQVAPEELFEALVKESQRLHESGEDSAAEFDLLWYLLPLARRLGILQDYEEEVARAIDLASHDIKRALAFASLKAELEERKGHLLEATTTIRAALEEASKARQANLANSEALLAIQLGRLLIRLQQLSEAKTLLEELAPALDHRGARALVASCSFYLGNIAVHQARFDDGLALHRSALSERRKLGAPKSIGASLSALGALATQMGRYMEALGAYREAGEIFTKLGDQDEASFAQLGIGRALSRLGDHAAASRPLRRALSLRELAGGDAVGQAIARLAVAENYLHLELAGEALREARHALFDLTLLTDATPRADAEQLLGRILLSLKQVSQSIQHLKPALEGHQNAGASNRAAMDLAIWLDAALLREDTEEIAKVVTDLGEATARCTSAERREILEFRLYKGLSWLADHHLSDHRLALPHLESAYAGLMAKTHDLPPEERHRFLFQIPDHEQIVTTATARGLALPASSAGQGVPSTQPLSAVE